MGMVKYDSLDMLSINPCKNVSFTSASTFTQPAVVKTFCIAVSDPIIRKLTMSPGSPALSPMRRGIFENREGSMPGIDSTCFTAKNPESGG